MLFISHPLPGEGGHLDGAQPEKADEEFRLEYIDTDIPFRSGGLAARGPQGDKRSAASPNKMLGYLRNLLVQTDASQRNMLLDKLKVQEITDPHRGGR